VRIISGYARGLKLRAPHGQAIRPTSDRAREALFSIIGNRIRGARVLDLFAGTGAFGLEALSRGARHVTFVDNNPEALALITKNIQLFPPNPGPADPSQSAPKKPQARSLLQQPVTLLHYDLEKTAFFSKHEQDDHLDLFDLIFLDPPYGKGLSLQTLTNIDKNAVLKEGGLAIAEDRSEIVLPDTFSSLTIADRRRYGGTGFWFYTTQ
jgi:16S rRNA (guanine966-N2)-methyltransferase